MNLSLLPAKKRYASLAILLAYIIFSIRRYIRQRQYSLLKGKTVLITGAGHGLGRCMAVRLAKLEVARLILWDINEEMLSETSNALLDINEKVEVIIAKVDVSTKEAVEEAKRALGGVKVDIMILNAGVIGGNFYIPDIPEASIQRTFNVNVMQLFWLSQAFLPEMMARDEGHVVTIASMSGLTGLPRGADYCASKWAANGFAESLHCELKERKSNVETTLINPMFINTGMFKGAKPPLLTTMLKIDDVSERVIHAILAKEPSVGLPGWLPSLTLLVRALPTAFGDFFSSQAGVFSSMSQFKGHSK